MLLPLMPILVALAAGGSLVPHAAGGLIVNAAAGGGYIAGTYVSTAAIATALSVATGGLATGVAVLTGAVTSMVGGAGIFGTTIGATGLTGALMTAGILPSTPVIAPVLVAGAVASCGYVSYRLIRLKRKIHAARVGEEAQFTETEAKLIESILKALNKKGLIT
jgi:hypothetical protein